MIRTTYLGQDVFIANDPPNWVRGFETTHRSFGDAQQSLTMRSTRRPFQNSLLTTVKSSATVQGAALRTLQGLLRQLKAQPVVSPFWPAASFWSDRASVKIVGGLYVAFKRDWSQWELYLFGLEPGWPSASDMVAPVVFGFYSSRSDLKWIAADAAAFPTMFEESSKFAYGLSFTGASLTDGPQPTGYSVAPKLFPFRADHRAVDELMSIQVSRSADGFTRDRSGTFYPHEIYREQSASYTVRGAADVATLLAFFDFVAGQGASFWAASSLSVGQLSASAISSATALAWLDVGAIVAGDYVCTFVGGVMKFGKISTIVGTTVTLSASLGVALPAGQPFYQLCLAKLTSPDLNLKWASVDLVTATIKWSQVKSEEFLPAGETIGTTLGQLPLRAVLFQFTRDYGNGTVTNQYFTSHEQDIEWNGQTWFSAPMGCGDIPTSLNLENDSFDVTGFLTNLDGSLSGHPLADDLALTSEAAVNITVYFVDVSDDGIVPMLGVGGDDMFGVGDEELKGVGE